MHIDIEKADPAPALGQGDGKIDRHRAFADATFPG